MKGYRFYAEYDSPAAKRRREGNGNVVAVLLDEHGAEYWIPGKPIMKCISAIFSHPNSPVASGGVHRGYLARKCRRVSEARAREIHPAMFAWLDSFEGEG